MFQIISIYGNLINMANLIFGILTFTIGCILIKYKNGLHIFVAIESMILGSLLILIALSEEIFKKGQQVF